MSIAPTSVDGPARSVATTTTFIPIDLPDQFNNQAISTTERTGTARFNVWGNSFPAEHLPPPGSTVCLDGVPFLFGSAVVAEDNIRCAGQFVPIPSGDYDWLYLLVASERRTEDTIGLHFTSGAVDFEALRVSDFWAGAHPAFGDRMAFQTPVMHYPHHVQHGVPALMWTQRVPVIRRETVIGLRLPRNVAIHVFAVTLQSTMEGR